MTETSLFAHAIGVAENAPVLYGDYRIYRTLVGSGQRALILETDGYLSRRFPQAVSITLVCAWGTSDDEAIEQAKRWIDRAIYGEVE